MKFNDQGRIMQMHTHTHFLFFFYPQEVPCIINLIFQSKTPLSLHCCFCLSLYLQQVSRHPCLQPGYWTGPWHINAAHSPLYNSEVSFQLSTNYILQWKWKVKKKKRITHLGSSFVDGWNIQTSSAEKQGWVRRAQTSSSHPFLIML